MTKIPEGGLRVNPMLGTRNDPNRKKFTEERVGEVTEAQADSFRISKTARLKILRNELAKLEALEEEDVTDLEIKSAIAKTRDFITRTENEPE